MMQQNDLKEQVKLLLETFTFYIAVDFESNDLQCFVGMGDIPEDTTLEVKEELVKLLPTIHTVLEKYANDKQLELQKRFSQTSEELSVLRNEFVEQYLNNDVSKLVDKIIQK